MYARKHYATFTKDDDINRGRFDSLNLSCKSEVKFIARSYLGYNKTDDCVVLLLPHTSLPYTAIGLIRLSNMCNIMCGRRVPTLLNLVYIAPIALSVSFDR